MVADPDPAALSSSVSVYEIFASIQGEGTWTGRAAVFIRFSGCPLNCFWCDEPRHRELDRARRQTPEALLVEARRVGPGLSTLVLTGGEPLAAPHLQCVTACFQKAGYWMALETSGVGGEIPEEIDWVTLSPKTALPERLFERANEIKYVLSGTSDENQMREILRRSVKHPSVWIQPRARDGEMVPETLEQCVDLVLKSQGRLRLSLQTHKWIGMP